jgi:hypothetical protein
MEAFAAPIEASSARALNLPAKTCRPRIGSMGVAHAGYAKRRSGDVDARCGKGPFGNPFPLAPGATRSGVCSAFARVLQGEDPAHVAHDREGPALPLCAELASPEACACHRQTIEGLAHIVAGGGRIRQICACFLKQCHAMSIAKHVRSRAEALVEARTGAMASAIEYMSQRG